MACKVTDLIKAYLWPEFINNWIYSLITLSLSSQSKSMQQLCILLTSSWRRALVVHVDGVRQGGGEVTNSVSLDEISKGSVISLESVALENGAEKAPTNHLSTTFYPEAEEVEPPQPSASESKDEDSSPPKKKLRKALNDARTDSKVSFQ